MLFCDVKVSHHPSWCIVMWCNVAWIKVIRNSEDCIPTSFDFMRVFAKWVKLLLSATCDLCIAYTMPSCKSGCDKADGVKRNEHQEQHEGLPQKLDLSKVFRNLMENLTPSNSQFTSRPLHQGIAKCSVNQRQIFSMKRNQKTFALHMQNHAKFTFAYVHIYIWCIYDVYNEGRFLGKSSMVSEKGEAKSWGT